MREMANRNRKNTRLTETCSLASGLFENEESRIGGSSARSLVGEWASPSSFLSSNVSFSNMRVDSQRKNVESWSLEDSKNDWDGVSVDLKYLSILAHGGDTIMSASREIDPPCKTSETGDAPP